MPISAEQWRAMTGSLNTGKGSLRQRPTLNPPSQYSLCDLPSPPPASWKGYYIAMVLLFTPLLYKMYLVGVAIIMYLVTSTPCTNTGLTVADVSTSYINHQHDSSVLPLSLCGLNVLLYVAMVIVVALFHVEEYRQRDKHRWMLIQQLHHLAIDLFWLTGGPDCEVIYDPNTHEVYATLSMNDLHSESALKCGIQTLRHDLVKRDKRSTIGYMIGVVSFFLQLSTLVVAAMLLLKAGDVERNPGPVRKLTIEDHFEVLEYLYKDMNNQQIRLLGEALGLNRVKLECMNDLPADMISAWLRAEDNVLTNSRGQRPYWNHLVEALKKIGQNGIAEKISSCKLSETHMKEERCVQPITPVSSPSIPRESTASQKNVASNDKETTDQLASQDMPSQDVDGMESNGECLPSPKYHFPYLHLSEKYDSTQTSTLHARLCSDFDEMTDKFQDLMDMIEESLERRGKTAIDILSCVSQYKALEPSHTDLSNRQPEFRHQFPELEKPQTSIGKAMYIISNYSSFFNYRLVSRIIKKVGTAEDKEKLEKYESEFQKYAQRTVYECPLAIGATVEGWPPFVVKIHHQRFEGCSLNQLTELVKTLAKIFKVNDWELILNYVTPGCLELSFQASQSTYEKVFPLNRQQEQELAALGVIKISAGDYQYPSSKDDGDDDGDHKDDRPDDAPSDSGIHTASETLSQQSKQDIVKDHEIDVSVEHQGRLIEKKTSSAHGTSYPLHTAARRGQLLQVKELVEKQSYSPVEKDQFGNTALHHAVQGSHLDVLKYFIESQQHNPMISNSDCETPLHLAARLGHLSIVKYLISEQGVDPMCKDEQNDSTPLHEACIGGHLDVVKYLVKECKNSGVNITGIFHDKTKEGLTPLGCASTTGHNEIVKFVISNPELKCAPLSQPEISKSTDCQFDSSALNVVDPALMLKHFHDSDALPKATNEMEIFNSLLSAAANGQLETVKSLLQNESDSLRAQAMFFQVGIYFAALGGHLNVVKFFISERKCFPDIQDPTGRTPLHHAAKMGYVDIVKYLIEDAKCNPTIVDNKQATPLHKAAEHGRLEVVKFLSLDRSCNFSCRDADNNTPLHLAAMNGHLNVVKFFITELKCDPNNPGENDRTPLHYATQNGHVDIMKYLIDSEKCNPVVNRVGRM